ncbi:hypothetical protein EGR_11190 [Echinococcus granulosus]|uniref:Uncharacterized protein n=1 Tax=Echinococcus granulosus TaxID=6210 RepID=W6TZ20_ECHGR|nr:hypothetical protein EGR_11190 [Echinococcus granulosus]EUB53953.1 hypothetical protein EGR_11190 [Echinococcus granulosus]
MHLAQVHSSSTRCTNPNGPFKVARWPLIAKHYACVGKLIDLRINVS